MDRWQLLRVAIALGAALAVGRIALATLYRPLAAQLWQRAIGPIVVRTRPAVAQSEDSSRVSFMPAAASPNVLSIDLTPRLHELFSSFQDAVIIVLLLGVFPEFRGIVILGFASVASLAVLKASRRFRGAVDAGDVDAGFDQARAAMRGLLTACLIAAFPVGQLVPDGPSSEPALDTSKLTPDARGCVITSPSGARLSVPPGGGTIPQGSIVTSQCFPTRAEPVTRAVSQ